MAKDTKERILDAALEIFARDGYAGTNIKDIAEAVGIVKSALYRHFESKEEIWNGVFDMMTDYYNERFGASGGAQRTPANTDELMEMTRNMVNFTVHDKRVKEIRKIMLTEQFRDERIKALASKHFLYNTEEIFTHVFTEMMKEGIIRETDPKVLAFSYTTPITALIHLCDREPEKEKEAMDMLQKFMEQFVEEWGKLGL